MAARIRKGDLVVVISGRDKGKTGKITRVFPEADKVLVEGINLVKKHQKEAGIIEKTLPLHASKVMPVDPETGKGTRVRFEVKDGEKVRIAKSGAVIANAPRE